MFTYIARQAILDRNKELYAYKLLFRDGLENCIPDISPDEAASRILTNSHLDLGLEGISAGKAVFINFHQNSLLGLFPTSLDPKNLVVGVLGTVELNTELVNACKTIKQQGYTLALDVVDFSSKCDVILPFIDFANIDVSMCDDPLLLPYIAKCKDANIKLVADNIESIQDFDKYCSMNFDYFQGNFFTKPEILKRKTLPTSKSLLSELIGASSAEHFDLDEMVRILGQDVSLTYKLMRFINNPTINKANEITSLSHALNYMGEVEIKKFIAILALANLSDGNPLELLHLSLVRAKFCELTSRVALAGDNSPKGFLLGLFSLLDALLDQPMPSIVEMLPISDNIKVALCGGDNELRPFLLLNRAFESGYWKGVADISNQLSVDLQLTQAFYNESLKWAGAMRQSMTD